MAQLSWRPALVLGFVALILTVSTHPADARDDASTRDLRLGKGLYDQRLFDRAIPPLERVRSGDPSDSERAEALFLLGEAYRSLDRLDEAETRFGELLQRAAESEWASLARLGRGEALVRLDRAKDAVPLLEAAVRGLEEEEQPSARYWLAEARARLGEIDGAIASWRAIVEATPDHELAPFAAYNAGLRLRDAERPDEGLALIDRLPDGISDASLRDRLHLLSGELALAAGDPKRAMTEYRAVEGEESAAAALAGLAWAASALDDTATLEIARRRLSEKHASSAERLEIDLLVGSARARAGDIAGTDGALSTHTTGPRADEARFWRAWSRREAGQPEAAAELFLSVEGNGDWATRAVLRGEEELRRAEKWNDSIEAARRFIETWGDDPRASAVIAGAVESSYRLGEDARVLELEQRFHAKWPDDALAAAVRHYAAEAALRSDDAAGAVERFAVLWRDPARRGAIGARYAWALSEAGGPDSGPQIAGLLGALEGAVASEVGILLGRTRLEAGDSDGALTAFRAAVAADPEGEAGARARLEEAIVLGSSGSGNDAELAYRAVLESATAEPVRARARIDLASLLAARGDDANAAKEYALYLEEHPEGTDRSDAWIGVAFCRWRTDDLDGALAAVNGLRAEDPSDENRAEALYIEGRIHREKGDAAAATRALTAYMEKHGDGPRAPEALVELSHIAEEAGDAPAATRALAERLEKFPTASGTDEVLYRLGWIELSSDDSAAAAARFRSLIQGHPDSEYVGDAHFRLGEIAYAADQPEEARTEYRLAIASPDSARIAERARYRIGWSHRKAEEWAEARAAFEELAKEHPDGDLTGEAIYLAADAAERLEDGAGERALLERFLTEHPEHERGPAARIRLSERLTDDEEWARIRTLLDPLRTVVLDEPWLTRHRIALGRALVRLGSARSALPILNEALDEGGARAAEAQFEIGLAHRAAGDRDRAIEAFIHGPVLYPFKPWAMRSHLEAGRDLLRAGKRKEARRVLELAIREDKDGPYGKEAKKLLGQPIGDKEEF